MKKIISVLLSIVACVTMVACNQTDEPITPPIKPPTNQEETLPETPNEEEETPSEEENKGNVVTPIRPGGNYEIGDNYG